jgi:diphosphomevalonate decarboxylase
MIIAITDQRKKPVSSTNAMNHTRETSPFYKSFIKSTKNNLEQAVLAIKEKNFIKLGELTEHSALSMHAAALAAYPGIVMFNGTTVDVLHEIRALRAKGIPAYFTCDAGPQPKVLCRAKHSKIIENHLKQMPGIKNIITGTLGSGAEII